MEETIAALQQRLHMLQALQKRNHLLEVGGCSPLP